MYETLIATRNLALEASQRASMWYDYLWQDFLAEKYVLHTEYAGLILSSIFDAKPVAYRARVVEQFIFEFPEHPLAPLDTPESLDNTLQEYYEAYLAEKEAWSLYTANYNVLIDAALKEGVEFNRNDRKYAWFDNGKIRVLEVKPCK